MKTILIATDFSSASSNALLYAVQLGKAFNAKLIVFHAYTIPALMPALTIGMSNYGVMTEIKEQLDEFTKAVLKEKAAAVETVCEVGGPTEAILKMATEKNADLIVTGMKGAGKNLKKVFGSTATSLITQTKVPVLIIPEEAEFTKPHIIAFATEGAENPLREDLDKIKDFTATFEAKVYVVKVITEDETEHLMFSENAAEEQYLNVSFEYPKDADISHGLNTFIQMHNVQMLVMMPHKHDWVYKLFRKSETKDMIFHTHIPLLILPDTFN